MHSLRLLDDLTPDRIPGDDVAYLKHFRPVLARYYKMSPYTSRAFLHQAKLARDDKRYDDAERFINAAIAMEPEDYTLYDMRREIETSQGKDAPATIEQNYRRGLYQARFTLKRRDNPDDAQQLATIEQMINAERSQNSPRK